MAFLLGRHQIFLDLKDDMPYVSDLKELMSNSNLSQYFLTLAREVCLEEISGEKFHFNFYFSWTLWNQKRPKIFTKVT